MSKSVTYQEVVDFSRRLMTLVNEYEQVLVDLAEAEGAYTLARAEAMLRSAEPNAEKQKADAIVKSKKLYMDYLHKKSVKEFYLERFENARTAISAMKQAAEASMKADSSTMYMSP